MQKNAQLSGPLTNTITKASHALEKGKKAMSSVTVWAFTV